MNYGGFYGGVGVGVALASTNERVNKRSYDTPELQEPEI